MKAYILKRIASGAHLPIPRVLSLQNAQSNFTEIFFEDFGTLSLVEISRTIFRLCDITERDEVTGIKTILTDNHMYIIVHYVQRINESFSRKSDYNVVDAQYTFHSVKLYRYFNLIKVDKKLVLLI